MPSPTPALTMEYIRSPDCKWPVTVKARATDIIRLNAELVATKHKTVDHNMLSKEKIAHLAEIAEAHRKLARAYTLLQKELVYALTRLNQITEGN